MDYAGDTLVTAVTLECSELDLVLECSDVVDFLESVYLRRTVVYNKSESAREIRLLYSQDFHISGTDVGVGYSAYYQPELGAIHHYKGKRWFLVNVAQKAAEEWSVGADEWAVGIKETQAKEGTWCDAEDGSLSGNAVAQGSVDSAVALHLNVPGRGLAQVRDRGPKLEHELSAFKSSTEP